MTDQHPIASPPRLADAALAALGGRLEYGDFRTISAVEIDVIHDALERLKQLELKQQRIAYAVTEIAAELRGDTTTNQEDN